VDTRQDPREPLLMAFVISMPAILWRSVTVCSYQSKVVMSDSCSNACKLSPMDSIGNIGAIHLMNSVVSGM